MVDRRQLVGGLFRGALTVGSFSALQSWVAAKPGERNLYILLGYHPTEDLPEAGWTLEVRDKSWREPRTFSGNSFETVVMQALVSVKKGL